ncbi:hypothetical protein OAA45_00285 [bacterium]|nr:hypothetical protein [bacterium]
MSDTHLPHNNKELGKPLRNPKKRSAVFLVVMISVGAHVLGLGIFGVIKIVETISPPPEFEAPPIMEMDTPPPPPPPPPTTKRTQKSLPRPQPLAAKNPQNMSVPAIVMQDSDVSFGRGMGGGFGEMGGGILDRVDISFFGIEGGSNVVVLFDRTGSGKSIFNRTRQELKKTIESMTGNPDARLVVIYFGGREGGHQGISKNGSDPTRHDYWYPKGMRSNTWLRPERGEAKSLLGELDKITIDKPAAKDPKDRNRGKADFVLGTNFFGGLENAYKLDPPPETVYIMVEPQVAFTSEDVVRKAYASWEKYGIDKPENTKLIFVVGKPAKSVKDKKALNLALNLLSGGNLTAKQLKDRIVY